MNSVQVGQVAPSFRLPSGQGPEVGPEHYRGKRNVIVWFTKGMACAFCRQHMTQLIRGYRSFQDLNTEILEVTPSTPERGKFYAASFNIPFPYLCDPDYHARKAWGLELRSRGPAWYATRLYFGFTASPPPSDFPAMKPALGEFPKLLADEDMGFYILDKQGVVRYSLSGSYMDGKATRQIPGNEEIVRELKRCN